MSNIYAKSEFEQQKDFFNNLNWEEEIDLSNDTDGQIKGVLFEFKKSIPDINKALFQAIKYLSFKRIEGKDVPNTIALVDFSKAYIYIYKSSDFLEEIEQLYVGGASKNNNNFYSKNIKPITHNFHKNGFGFIEEIIDTSDFIKVHIDQNNVLGWSQRYYQNEPFKRKLSSWKEELFQELKNPTCSSFKYIYKWEGSEKDFEYIMDCLNDPLNKKILGAFYTPDLYCKKSVELVKEAIKRLPKDIEDYVIVDRCGGTGNLESSDNGFTNEMLSHTIISTYELKEWEVLYLKLGSKVRCIIPPKPDKHDKGLLQGGDALAQAVFNELVPYVNNPKIAIILFENPPYRDSSADCGSNEKSTIKNSFVYKEMYKHLNDFAIKNISTIREIANDFIWSGFEYYLNNSFDYYVLFSPIKYWKSQGIVNKRFIKGFLFNKKHFHATSSTGITCILWQNENSHIEEIELTPYDMNKNKLLQYENINVKKIHKLQTFYYDRNANKNDGIAFMQNNSVIPDYKNATLINWLGGGMTKQSGGFTRGFWITKDNLERSIVPWVSNYYDGDSFIEKEVLFKCADKEWEFTKDKNLIKSCLIWSSLSIKNKCKSYFDNNKLILNQISLNKNSILFQILQKYELNGFDEELIKKYDEIINLIKINNINKDKFNENFYYGISQIDEEFNTTRKVKEGNKEIKIYDFPELNTSLIELKNLLKQYYAKNISDKLKKYELIK